MFTCRSACTKGSYHHVATKGRKQTWTPLGNSFGEALTKWAALEVTEIRKRTRSEDLMRDFTLRELPTVKEKTAKEWKRLMGVLEITFKGAPLSEIRPVHINGHVEKRRQEGAPVSGNREAALLQRMLSTAVRWGWIERSPYHDIKLNGEKKRSRYLKNGEFARIRAAAPPMIQANMDVGYLTGLRIGDLLRLAEGDIEEGCLWVRQEKNEVAGRYRVNAQLAAALDRARALRPAPPKVRNLRDPVYIFAKRNRAPYSYYGFRSIFERACARAGVEDVHFHDIRAKAISDVKNAGRDHQAFSLHRSREQADDYVRERQNLTVEPADLAKILELDSVIGTARG